MKAEALDRRGNEYWSIGNGQISGIGGSCLDVQGSAPVDGAGVIAVSCNGSPSQHWTLAGDSVVGIGGKCLDILHGAESDFTPGSSPAVRGSPRSSGRSAELLPRHTRQRGSSGV